MRVHAAQLLRLLFGQLRKSAAGPSPQQTSPRCARRVNMHPAGANSSGCARFRQLQEV